MLCGISGEAPQEPVVSKKSGVVYEKRLIEQYINEHGTEPSSGEALTADDLLPIQSSRIVRPRPPTLTSIPALLATFQNEWDALALETYNLKEQLARTREELSTALYQHDAAVRVIARLSRERDEAREALGKLTVSDGANGDAMAIDSTEGLPEDLATSIDETHATLSKGRKRRPIPEGWATPDEITTLEQGTTTSLPVSDARYLDVSGAQAAASGLQGGSATFSIDDEKVDAEFAVNEPVTNTAWAGSKIVFGTAQGSVKVFDNGSEVAQATEHAGPVAAVSVHPSGAILASVGSDKSIVFYELETLKRVSRAFTNSALTACAFHPDGHLLAAGTATGTVRLYMTKTLEQAAEFELESGVPVQALTFSENGFWLAAAAKRQSTVKIFDLRKEGAAATAKVLETGGDVESLSWDYTGQFLATGGPSGITVQQYLKASKAWSEPFRSSVPAIGVRWGEQGRKLVVLTNDNALTVFGVKA